MSTAGHTPNFIAQSTLYPFRVVQFGSNAFSLMHATQSDEVLAGVTDGSVQGFNATTHATAGQVCSLQNGEFVQVTAGDTIVPADLLVATTDGKVIPAQLGSTEAILQAAEGAEDGEILWAKRIGAWTLGGSSPITGGLSINTQEFDDPESEENIWTKPAGAYMVFVSMCGGGQDGQPGGSYYGGNGGSAAHVAQKWMLASSLPSTVPVGVAFNRPWNTSAGGNAISYCGDSNDSALCYCVAGPAGIGPNDDNSGTDVQYASSVSISYGTLFGQNGNGESGITTGAAGAPMGPGGGGAGGSLEGWQADDYGGPGGFAGNGMLSTSWPYMVGLGGAGGMSGIPGSVGGNGGNGGFNAECGFGHGAGGGGQGTGGPGGNGGDAVRGGGGGGGGQGSTFGGFGGQGGAGFVRVTTICFS